MIKKYYDQDCNLSMLDGKTIAVIGFGSQGHAHAMNLKESGMNVVVGLRPGSAHIAKAEAAGIKVMDIEEAAEAGDIVMMLAPDELQAKLYKEKIEKQMQAGNILMFADGFNSHFQQIIPQKDIDVIMVAPKGPGHIVRRQYTEGMGVPSLIAVHQDASGKAKDYALMKAGFETLVEAGYAPEMAYFECIHEMKLIVDLINEGGFEKMRYSVSNTAEYGDYVTGKKIIGKESREAMKQVLADIQDGTFASNFIQEFNAGGKARFLRTRDKEANHQLCKTGKELRAMMSWLK